MVYKYKVSKDFRDVIWTVNMTSDTECIIFFEWMIKGDLKVMNEIHLDLFQNKEIKSKYTFKQSSFILFVGQKIEGGRDGGK